MASFAEKVTCFMVQLSMCAKMYFYLEMEQYAHGAEALGVDLNRVVRAFQYSMLLGAVWDHWYLGSPKKIACFYAYGGLACLPPTVIMLFKAVYYAAFAMLFHHYAGPVLSPVAHAARMWCGIAGAVYAVVAVSYRPKRAEQAQIMAVVVRKH